MKTNHNSKFIQTASNIGIEICRDAIWSNNRCNWLTLSHDPDSGDAYFRALYNEFYVGTVGVAYFLAALYQVDSDPLFKKTALGAVRQALSQIEKTEAENRIGFFRGWTGIAYTALYVGQELESEEILEGGKTLIKKINKLKPEGLKLDIVEGISGAIPVLLKIYRQYPSTKLKKQLYQLGDHLLSTAIKSEQGWSWETIKGNKHLTGFAHGASGFIYALLELYQLDKKEKYREAANQAWKFETAHFNIEEQNWPDYRSNGQQLPEDHQYPCVNAWCHGAPGIGLSRVRAYEITGDDFWKKDATIAISSTLKHTYVSSDYHLSLSLCHGVFGNADLLINGSLAFKDDELWETAINLGEEAIAQYADRELPWDNGVGTTHQIPDFMLGLSGIGYYFLRLTDPKKFESVLLLSGD